ncbi:hypothetical protein KFL_016070010, partial [Klebsormidium nitens]
MGDGLSVDSEELKVGTKVARYSEALRVLCGYVQQKPADVRAALGSLANTLEMATVMRAIKQHHLSLVNPVTLDRRQDVDTVLVLLIKDEGHQMVKDVNSPAHAQEYGRDMTMATQAYRCTTATAAQSQGSQQGICMYTIVAGTLLRELMPPADSQYVYTTHLLTPIDPQRAREMLRQYVEGFGGA